MTVITQHKKHRDRLAWAALVAFLALLIGYDLRWLSVNVTLLGWDPPSHLLKTLTYARLLQDHSAQSLFSIFTWDLYRPPLFHLSAVPLYWLLGYSTDVATAMNAVWLAGLVLGTFFLGRRLFGATAGLWSAMFVGLYPMVFCLAHYFYLEVAVSALVVWSVWTLLAAEGFTRRPYSLLLGLLVEAGMLVKWTYAAYFVFPLLVVLAYQWQRRHLSDVNLRINNNRWALVSLGVSGLLTMAWYGPNWELIPTLAPGRMLPVASFALWAVTIFLVREGRSRVGQLAAAAGMGASVASLWYLPHIDFLDFFFAVAYKGEGTGPAQFAWAEIETYTYYARKLYSEHMGLGFALLTVLATGAWLWHRRHELRKEFALWMLLAWVGGTYVLFTVATIRNTRIIMPVLPALALLTAGGLATIRSATVRRTLTRPGAGLRLGPVRRLELPGVGFPAPGRRPGLRHWLVPPIACHWSHRPRLLDRTGRSAHHRSARRPAETLHTN